eukprot:scaffold2015_cov186-Amphora_coffeaeformis.AAC.3
MNASRESPAAAAVAAATSRKKACRNSLVGYLTERRRNPMLVRSFLVEVTTFLVKYECDKDNRLLKWLSVVVPCLENTTGQKSEFYVKDAVHQMNYLYSFPPFIGPTFRLHPNANYQYVPYHTQ